MSSALSHGQVLATKIDRMADDYPAVEVPTPDYTPLRRAQSISGYSTTREPMDNYPTPDIATLSLLAREDFPGTIWEPACGSGNIARHFPHCIATDIRSDNIFGEARIDFLTEYRQVDHIITNPPIRFVPRTSAENSLRVLKTPPFDEGGRQAQTEQYDSFCLVRVGKRVSRKNDN